MTRLELATETARLINASDSRLGATVVNRNNSVMVRCRVGKHTVEILFPSKGKPDYRDYGSKLLCVKSAREAIDAMPASDD